MIKIKKIERIAFCCAVLLLFVGFHAFPQVPEGVNFEDLKTSMENFTGNLAKSLPFNSSLGLTWSDAFIQKAPHFGIGISMGFTTMEADSLKKLLSCFEMDLPMNLKGFPIPGYTVEGRIGGFVLPFDIGVKFGYLPIKPAGIKLDYFLAGGDIRYALLEQNLVLPAISLGVGFNYLSGGIGKSIGSGLRFDYEDISGTSQHIDVSRPDINFNWSTATLDFKAQISKTFFIITPFLGLGASHGWSKAAYSVKADITDSSGNIDEAKEILKQYGIYNLDEHGFSSNNNMHGWSTRIFGGLSFNIAVLRINFTGLYSFIDKNYGASLGFRVQL